MVVKNSRILIIRHSAHKFTIFIHKISNIVFQVDQVE
jgi:hypothetical protein